MKSLNKRKQSLNTVGSVINACVCTTHRCGCDYYPGDTMILNREDLYQYAIRTGDEREPTSIGTI